MVIFMQKYTVTIARSFGSGGDEMGKELAKRLNIDYYDRDLIKLASEESGINIELFGKADETVKAGLFKKYDRSYGQNLIPPYSNDFTSDKNLFDYQAKIIKQLSDRETCIIVGRCAGEILRGRKNILRAFIHADRESCIANVMEKYGLDRRSAEHQIDKVNHARNTYFKYYTGKEWNDASNYDICLNITELGFERAVDVLVNFIYMVYSD